MRRSFRRPIPARRLRQALNALASPPGRPRPPGYLASACGPNAAPARGRTIRQTCWQRSRAGALARREPPQHHLIRSAAGTNDLVAQMVGLQVVVVVRAPTAASASTTCASAEKHAATLATIADHHRRLRRVPSRRCAGTAPTRPTTGGRVYRQQREPPLVGFWPAAERLVSGSDQPPDLLRPYHPARRWRPSSVSRLRRQGYWCPSPPAAAAGRNPRRAAWAQVSAAPLAALRRVLPVSWMYTSA